MRWVLGLVIALAVSSCVSPATVATTPANSSPSPIAEIPKDDWDILDNTEIAPVQKLPRAATRLRRLFVRGWYPQWVATQRDYG